MPIGHADGTSNVVAPPCVVCAGPTRSGRINVRFLLLLLVAASVVIGGAVWLHGYRRQKLAARLRQQGMQAYGRAEWADAANYLGLYLSRSPDDLEALLRYAEVQMRLQPRRADNLRQAASSYQRILQLNPGHRLASEKLAGLFLAAGQPAEAERVLRARLAAADDDVAARVLLARCLIRQQQFPAAAEQLRQAIELDPQRVEAYGLLGFLQLQQLADPAAASQTFDDLLARNQRSSLAHVLRARFFRLQGDRAAALAELRQAESLRPADSKTLLELADELARLGQLDQAEHHLRAALRGDEGSKLAAYAALARLALRRNSSEQAIQIVEQALVNLDDDRRVAILPLAVRCCLVAGQLEQAQRYMDQLKQAAPDSSALQFVQALVAAARGQHWSAIAMLRTLLGRQSEVDQAWLALAEQY
ncbi:MAG: tetratricopeptide repeat protein, partial [Phycisphaerae bacterium]